MHANLAKYPRHKRLNNNLQSIPNNKDYDRIYYNHTNINIETITILHEADRKLKPRPSTRRCFPELTYALQETSDSAECAFETVESDV